MNKKTIIAGISALAIGGVLAGAALTSTAQAASPTTPPATSHVTPAPNYSKSFHLQNMMHGETLKLVGVEGQQEGVPPIGSTITEGQWQNFEVQYIAAGTGNVWATYEIIDNIHGYVDKVEINMSYGCFGETKTTITRNSHLIHMHIEQGSSTNPWIAIG